MRVIPLSEPSEGGRLAVILPGLGYPVEGPLLFWTAQLLASRGWRVWAVQWELGSSMPTSPAEFVLGALDTALEEAGVARPDLLIAKSLGTYASSWAQQRSVPGIWLTPLLTDAGIKSALTQSGQPSLAVGGTADPYWSVEALAGSRIRVHSVPDADHALVVPGAWKRSLDLQRALFDLIEICVATVEAGGGDD